MKRDAKGKAVIQFGTEVVSSADGTIAGLLGASPGASTAVPIMLDVLAKCFPDRMAAWEPRLEQHDPELRIAALEQQGRGQGDADPHGEGSRDRTVSLAAP